MSTLQPPTSSELCLLSWDQFQGWWPAIEPHLRVPLLEADYPVEHIVREVHAGHIQVWTVGRDCVVLTRVLVHPSSKVLQIFWAEGSGMERYLETVFDVFQRYAAMVGCTDLEVFGRRGWERWLRRLPGVRKECVVMRYKVEQQGGLQ